MSLRVYTWITPDPRTMTRREMLLPELVAGKICPTLSSTLLLFRYSTGRLLGDLQLLIFPLLLHLELLHELHRLLHSFYLVHSATLAELISGNRSHSKCPYRPIAGGPNCHKSCENNKRMSRKSLRIFTCELSYLLLDLELHRYQTRHLILPITSLWHKAFGKMWRSLSSITSSSTQPK
jgi:hypothetical protein